MTTKTIQKRTISPFRYDIVGSFLRPERLKQAREQFIKKEITHNVLTEEQQWTKIVFIKSIAEEVWGD